MNDVSFFGKKVLLTGASGFVGSAVRDALQNAGAEVIGVSRTGNGATYARAVTADTNWVDLLEGVSFVIHAAAVVHFLSDKNRPDDQVYYDVNVEGTLSLARQAAQAGVERFVFLSTAKVAGEGRTPDLLAYKEIDTPQPRDAYSQSKWFAEKGLAELSQMSAMSVVIIRPPLVYGPGVKANFARMVRVVRSGLPLPFGAFDNLRSMVGLTNLVDFILLCMAHPAAANQTFFVSDNRDLSTPEIVQLIACALEKKARIFSVPLVLLKSLARIAGMSSSLDRLSDSFVVDTSKAKHMLEWRPTASIESELVRTVRSLSPKRLV